MNKSLSNITARQGSILLIAISAIFISGCGSQPLKEAADNLTAITNAFDPQALTQLEKAVTNQDWENAIQLRDKVNASNLNDEQYSRWSLLNAKTQLASGNLDQASADLSTERLLTILPQLEVDRQYQIIDLQATIDNQSSRWLEAAKKRIFIAPLLSEPQKQSNQQAIWQNINAIDADTLFNLSQTYSLNAANTDASQYELLGWIELALVSKSSHEDLSIQAGKLAQWRQAFLNHSANSQLPRAISILEETVNNTPRHIALVLPLTGRLAPAGQTVLNGFLAAFYQHANQPGGKVGLPKISVYDSTTIRELSLLYTELKSQQVDFVIGPIQKNLVKKLLEFDDLPIPTLSLNYIYDAGYSPIGLYQFGLSINAEAQQLARLAYLEGHKHALIIGPDQSWTKRAATNFQQQLESDGGSVTETAYYNNKERETSASETIKKLFEIDYSHARYREIRNATALKLEFEPRRRQDIDMVLMLGKPQQARSTKPLFAFHYGADLPVYSTSQSHDFDATRRQNTDLAEMKFTDIPWLLGEPDEFLNALSEREQSSPYIRLYAMGIDCFNLYPRIKQLAHHSGSVFYGRTGTLTVQNNSTLIRHLALAQYQDNEAKRLSLPEGSLESFSNEFNSGKNQPATQITPSGAINTNLPLQSPEQN